MAYQLDIAESRAVLSGDLTIYTVTDIRDQLRKTTSDDLEIDLAGVSEIDTAGLQLMLLLKSKPGGVRFVHHSAAVLRLVDLANLGQTLGDPMLIRRRAEEH